MKVITLNQKLTLEALKAAHLKEDIGELRILQILGEVFGFTLMNNAKVYWEEIMKTDSRLIGGMILIKKEDQFYLDSGDFRYTLIDEAFLSNCEEDWRQQLEKAMI